MKKIITSLCVLVLTPCNMNQQGTLGNQVGIDSPADGAILQLAGYTIIAHASKPTVVAGA